MGAKKRPKPCDYCSSITDIRYRIQYDAGDLWHLVCPNCWEKLHKDNPHYRYGGTWKAK